MDTKKFNKNRSRHINDLNNNIVKSDNILKKYNITIDDINKSSVNDDILSLFTDDGNLNSIFSELESYKRLGRKRFASELTLSELSIQNYKSRLRKLNKLFDCNNDLTCLDDPKHVIETFTKMKLPVNSVLSYINTIIGLTKYSKIFEKILENSLNEYKDIQTILAEQRNNELENNINYKDIINWDTILNYQKDYSISEPYSFNHLLSSLYTLIPPIRDDFSNVKLIKNNYENDTKNNFYNTKTKQLILNKYKLSDLKGPTKIKFPDELHKIVMKSIELQPREYLITRDNNEQVDKVYNSLSSQIKNVFYGLTINDLRHSFASKDFKGKGIDITNVKNNSKSMLHSLPVHLNYLRGILK